MPIKRILASEIAPLDSNVYTGGGTDATAALQAALDEALTCGGVHLVMDGAALVSSLRVHSNTTIECLSLDCGFFQMPQSNRGIISNREDCFYPLKLKNVTLKGGTYNQDCTHQEHHVPGEYITEDTVGPARLMEGKVVFTFGLEFYGVENLVVEDLHIRNFRTFALTVGGFKNVRIENVWLDLPDRMHAQNQDGFHFWGPGQFLTVKNVGGTVGDDFMNIGPDELDRKSGITDVIVDGVYLDDADQGIRLLSRGTGRLDRVTVKNISGTYRSFGFYLNCWFPDGTFGNFGNILFENIDLRASAPNYDYRPPILFSVGGNVECMTFRNIRHHNPGDKRTLFELGLPYYNIHDPLPTQNVMKMGTFIIDGLTVLEDGDAADGAEYIQIYEPVDRLVIRDLLAVHGGTGKDHLITFPKNGRLGQLIMQNAVTTGFDGLIAEPDKVGRVIAGQIVEN